MKHKRLFYLICIFLVLLTLVGITLLVCLLISKCTDTEFVDSLKIGLTVDGILAVPSIAFTIIRIFLKRFYESREYDYKIEYKNKDIRLSFAYLIRIRVNNKYLLVKSGHKRDLYGPVGGVYHIEHTDYIYHKLKFARDETPGDSEDVRGTIAGKNIGKFIRWFNKGINREVSPNREFEEELLKSGVVPNNLFLNQDFKYACTKYRGIERSAHYKKLELCRFDIFELLLTKEQEKFFVNSKDKRIFLATKEDIETGGVNKNNDRRIIGDQTPYILEV